ncbi:MAG: ATPase, partial [Psychrobacter alimentarius]
MNAATRYRLLNNFMIFISIIGVAVALLDSGFTLPTWLQQVFHIFYLAIIFLGFTLTAGRYLYTKKPLTLSKVAVFDFFTSIAIIILLGAHFTDLVRLGLSGPVDGFVAIKIAVFVTFIREMSDHDFNLKRTFLNPAQFFILSFLSVVLIG